MKKIVLVSGGLYSLVALREAQAKKDEVYCLNLRYTQTSFREVYQSQLQCKGLPYESAGVEFPCKRFRLLGLGQVPAFKSGVWPESPMYLPGLGLVLLGMAYEFAKGIGAGAIIIGYTRDHYAGFPESRTECPRVPAPSPSRRHRAWGPAATPGCRRQ